MKKLNVILLLALMLLGSGCAGIRYSDDGKTFVAHGESFHFLGLKIPRDELELAKKKIPVNAHTKTIYAPPSDWTSFLGIFFNIFPGFNGATISGEIE